MRTLPHSIEAEKGAIGSMLLSPNEAIAECVSQIDESFFFIPAHQTIYSALVDLWTKGEKIDLITFTQVLRDRNLLEAVGGAGAVTSFYTFVPTSANLAHYLSILQDKYILRSIVAAGTEAVLRAHEEQDEAMSILGEFQEKISNISSADKTSRKSIRQLVQEKIERMERGEQGSDIIKTGLKQLDYDSPLRNGDMPVLSGETKSGKSIIAVTIARNVAGAGSGVAIFGLESSVQEAIDRLFAGVARIAQQKLDHVANLEPGELQEAMKAAETLSALPIYLYDDIFDLHHIIAEARRLKAQRKVKLIIVDYAQLVRTRIEKNRNREQEVAHISRTIRLLAAELKIPIILISQINEEGRSRESRALEQDCTAFWKVRHDEDEKKRGHMRWIDIPFQRNGESGVTLPLTFLGHIGRVENCELEDEQ